MKNGKASRFPVEFGMPESTILWKLKPSGRCPATQARNAKIQRSDTDAIHDAGKVRRKLGAAAQGADGCHREDGRGGDQGRPDAPKRRARPNRDELARSPFSGKADHDRWAVH